LLYLGAWEVLLLVLAIFVIAWNPSTPEQPLLPLGVALVFLGLGLLGLLYLPLRGRLLGNSYTNRMMKLRTRYLEALTKAADKQVAYGMELRRAAVLPLTRLIDAQ